MRVSGDVPKSRSRQVSPVEVVDDCPRRIDAINPMLTAFCLADHEQARSVARVRRGAGSKVSQPEYLMAFRLP